MRTALIIITTAVLTAIITAAVTWHFLFNRWQPVRATLENVVLAERVDIGNLTLMQASEVVIKEVKAQKNVTLNCVFLPEGLAQRMPNGSLLLGGNAYFCVIALQHMYNCNAEAAGDDTILFTAE